jgi:hypothetical protein
MEQEFELIAKTFMGLEPVLAQELTQLGANNVQIGRRMVSFTGNKEMMYRANFQLHTAIRILKPIAHFKASSAEDMYEEVKKIDWSKYIEKGKTFSVDSVVYSEEFILLNRHALQEREARAAQPAADTEKKYVYGIGGIARLFGCSMPTANRIKKSGRIDRAITQIGRKIIVDADMALELAGRKSGGRG